MPWFIQLAVGTLIGIAFSNAWLRHHLLTLNIWVFKLSRLICDKLIWICEYTQDKFDDIECVSPTQKAQSPKQQTMRQGKISTATNYLDMTQAELIAYVTAHPEDVKIKRKGGE